MRVTVLQEHLAKGLNIVGRAVSSRSTLPVLGNVLLSTDAGRLKLSATNLEIVVTCWISADVLQEGAITVPARTFSDLINALSPERVELELSEQTQTVHVACGRTEANVRGIDAQEFPLVPEPDLNQAIKLNAGNFKQMITQVAFAAATDDTRPTLTGVSMTLENNTLRLAATDAFRLSVRSADLPNSVSERRSVIVPTRALSELARVINDDDELLYLSLPQGRNQIIFKLDNIVIVSQLIDGNYPDFSPIIPKKYKTRTVVMTSDMLNACKTASIFAREANHTARLKFVPADGLHSAHAIISANSQEMGDNVVRVEANIEGDGVEMSFNVKYLAEAVAAVGTPQVAIETNSALEPGVFKPVGEGGFFHIIMPMHSNR